MPTTFAPLKELEISTLNTFEEEEFGDDGIEFEEGLDDDEDGFLEEEDGDEGEGGNDTPKKPGIKFDPFGEPVEEF